MTASTLAAPAATDPGAASRPADAITVRPQTLGRAIRSEWVKSRTLRSTWVGLGSVLLILVGLAAIAAAVSTGSVANPDGDGGGGGDGPFGGTGPVSIVLTGADFAVLLMGVLGSMAGAREYGSRMIAATVASLPRRWQVVVAKATPQSSCSFAPHGSTARSAASRAPSCGTVWPALSASGSGWSIQRCSYRATASRPSLPACSTR